MSMIISLSVFNGFDELFKSLFSTFDPQLKVTAVKGKTFDSKSEKIANLFDIEGVSQIAEVLEENALFKYRDKEYIATLKGVSNNFASTNGIDSMIVDGQFLLHDEFGKNMAIIGKGVEQYLGVRLNFLNPIHVFVPKRNGKLTSNPEKAFNKDYLFPSGVFKIELDYDAKYVILPIDFARNLLDYTSEVSSLEISVKESYKVERVKSEIKKLLGEEYKVQDRFEQNESLFKIFKTEKSAVFMILTFILIIFSFNLIGTLTMLIIEKKNNIITLKNLGADDSLINRIFLLEGWLISIIGAVIGLILGFVLCYIQVKFGVIQLKGGSYIVDAYPMAIEFKDFILTFFTVAFLGWLSAIIPIRFLGKKGAFMNK